MGPLFKICPLIETVTNSNSERVELNLKYFENLTEQTVVTHLCLFAM